MEAIGVQTCHRVIDKNFYTEANLIKFLRDFGKVYLQNCFECSELKSEIAFCVIEHGRFLQTPQPWILSDEANEDPEGILHTREVYESVDHFEEACRIAQLVIDTFALEILSPNQKNSEQLSHLLLIVLELVDSVDISWLG